MAKNRSRSTSVLDEEGNMWVMGGTYEDGASDSTEVYVYQPKGTGYWRKGKPLPPDYRDTGIESHCTVRLTILALIYIYIYKII